MGLKRDENKQRATEELKEALNTSFLRQNKVARAESRMMRLREAKATRKLIGIFM